MALTPGLEIPFGIQPVNPVPVDTWSGPYYGPNETAAKAAANAAIPQAIRFQSLQVRLIIAGVPYIYWYDTGTTDTDLHIFSTGGGGTSGYSGYSGVSGWSGISGYSGFNANNQSVTYTNSFSAGQAIYKTTGGYDLALANDINTSEVIGVVQSANSSEFTYVINGYISGLTDIEDATCYYLSDTVPGQITTDAPTASGSVIKPVLIGTGTTTGVVVEFPGVIIGSTNNGTSGYLARWTGAHSLGNSSIFDSGPDVIIDATTTINGDFNILGTYLLSGVPVFDGVSGVSGYSGYSGTNGTNGISGMSGKSGYSGWSGYSGSGVSGYSGYSGISGFSGFSGYSGINGIIGVNGASGYSGISGYSGYSGMDSLGFNYRGQYDNTQTYSINDIVTNGQNLYVALASSTNPGIVLTNTAVWNKSVTGTSGYSGWSGISGFSGLGFSGYSGISGYSGYMGRSGYSGWSGLSGISGFSGVGTSGYSGYSGYSGAATPSWGLNDVASAAWFLLGTWNTSQAGNCLYMRLLSHCGYNGVATQNQVTELMFVTSNDISYITGSSGNYYAAGSSSVNSRLGTGGTSPSYQAPSKFRIIQVSKTQYQIYAYFSSAYMKNSNYSIQITPGDTWTDGGGNGGVTAPTGNYVEITPSTF